MIRLSRESVNWLFLEGLVIVTSILLAFWLEAWWQDRQDEETEAVLLRSLLSELEEQEQRFQDLSTYLPAVKVSIRRLLVESTRVEPILTDEQIDLLIADLGWYTEPINTSVLESLVSAETLSIVSNDIIRQGLSEWLAELHYLNVMIEAEGRFIYETLYPYMRQHSSYIQIWNLQASRPGLPNEIWDFERIELPNTVSHRDMIEDAEFQNLLLERDVILENIFYRLNTDAQNLTRIMNLVRQERED